MVPGNEEAFEAGKNIRNGDYTRSNLEIIIGWKSERRKGLIADNSDSEVADALRLALSATEPRSAFAVLIGLRGVAVPMASAILTAIDQDKYTISDYRAMDALGIPDADYTNLNFCLRQYFPECKRLAAEAGVRLRTLDKALWTWSGEKRRCCSALAVNRKETAPLWGVQAYQRRFASRAKRLASPGLRLRFAWTGIERTLRSPGFV